MALIERVIQTGNADSNQCELGGEQSPMITATDKDMILPQYNFCPGLNMSVISAASLKQWAQGTKKKIYI